MSTHGPQQPEPRDPVRRRVGRPVLALGLFALSLSLGLCWLLFNPPTYRATLGLQVTDPPITRASVFDDDGTASSVRLSLERLVTERVLQAAIELMAAMPSLAEHPLLAYSSRGSRPAYPGEGRSVDTVGVLRSRLRLVDETPASGRVRLAYQDRDPVFAIGVMLALSDVYQTRATTTSDGSRLRVVDQPRLDPDPIGATPLAVALQSLIVGAIAAMSVGLSAVWRRSPRLSSSQELQDVAAPLRVVQVPDQSTPSHGFRWQPGPRAGPADRLVALRMNDGPAVRALRRVANDVAIRVGRSEIRTLMVTSPRYGVGKGFVVGNLAVLLAQAGVRVLIIEVDWRHPRMPDLFDLASFHGLVDVLAGRAQPEAAIRRSRVAGIDLMLPGRVAGGGDPVVDAVRLGALIGRLAGEYPLILIDAAPAFVSRHAEMLAPIADETLVVTRQRHTARRELTRLLERLANAGARIEAVLFNRTRRERPQVAAIDAEADAPVAGRSA